ncbi:trigger factor-like [Liolophura sinensis]|uniref:trigger factor-like n=1 Tax=Liolophura sinensis TaxID=3198878 RepID=UPI00315835B6
MEHTCGNCCALALTYASKVKNSVQNTVSVQGPDQDVTIDVDVVGGGSNDDDLEFPPPAIEMVKLDKDNNTIDTEGEDDDDDDDDVDVGSDDDGDSGDGEDDDNEEMGADDETEIDATRAEDDSVGDMECDRGTRVVPNVTKDRDGVTRDLSGAIKVEADVHCVRSPEPVERKRARLDNEREGTSSELWSTLPSDCVMQGDSDISEIMTPTPSQGTDKMLLEYRRRKSFASRSRARKDNE